MIRDVLVRICATCMHMRTRTRVYVYVCVCGCRCRQTYIPASVKTPLRENPYTWEDKSSEHQIRGG